MQWPTPTTARRALAAHEPGVEFTIDARTINMTRRNVETARVNYHLMDVELLFSRNLLCSSGRAVRVDQTRNFTQEIKPGRPERPAGEIAGRPGAPQRWWRCRPAARRGLPYYANGWTKMNENMASCGYRRASGGRWRRCNEDVCGWRTAR